MPIGLAVLSALNTNLGATFLSLTKPIYSTILILIKPILIMVEVYYILEILRKFNRWISKKANKREDIRNDPYTWEAPLSRGAVAARIVVVMISLISYIGTYMMIGLCQSNLYKSTGFIPAIFEQSLVVLITLQFIAMTATILKEEGIISETALICLSSTTGIFIASLHQFKVMTSALLESGLVGK